MCYSSSNWKSVCADSSRQVHSALLMHSARLSSVAMAITTTGEAFCCNIWVDARRCWFHLTHAELQHPTGKRPNSFCVIYCWDTGSKNSSSRKVVTHCNPRDLDLHLNVFCVQFIRWFVGGAIVLHMWSFVLGDKSSLFYITFKLSRRFYPQQASVRRSCPSTPTGGWPQLGFKPQLSLHSPFPLAAHCICANIQQVLYWIGCQV